VRTQPSSSAAAAAEAEAEAGSTVVCRHLPSDVGPSVTRHITHDGDALNSSPASGVCPTRLVHGSYASFERERSLIDEHGSAGWWTVVE
jgi:hypothetical protein